MSTSKPSEDAKSFVEHVRTVHFWLLATCLAIFAAIQVDAPTDLRAAKKQLTRIAADSKQGGLSKTLYRSYSKFFQSGCEGLEDSDVSDFVRLIFVQNGVDYFLDSTIDGVCKLRGKKLPVFSRDNRLLFECGGLSTPFSRVYRSDIKPINNLADFELNWNCLNSLQSVVILELGSVATKQAKECGAEKSIKSLLKEAQIVSGPRPKKFEFAETGQPEVVVRMFEAETLGRFSLCFSIGSTPKTGSAAAYEAVDEFYGRSDALRALARELNGKRSLRVSADALEIPLSFRVEETDFAERVASEHFQAPIYKTFQRQFVELSEWAKEKKDWPLGVLVEALDIELAKSVESFEVAGVKIPRTLISTLGLLILASVQIYFFLHVRVLRTMFEHGYSIPTVPWIGLYQHWLARLMCFATAIVAPVWVLAMVLTKSFDSTSVYWVASILVAFLWIQFMLCKEIFSLASAVNAIECLRFELKPARGADDFSNDG